MLVGNAQSGQQALQWIGIGLLEAEQRFHRIRGYRLLGTTMASRHLHPTKPQVEELARRLEACCGYAVRERASSRAKVPASMARCAKNRNASSRSG